MAGRIVRALLDQSEKRYELHLPAPNGLAGGYPCVIQKGQIKLNLPAEWSQQEAEAIMLQAQQRDGVERIGDDGTIHFNQDSVEILQRELNMTIPITVKPEDLEIVANQQIVEAQTALEKSKGQNT